MPWSIPGSGLSERPRGRARPRLREQLRRYRQILIAIPLLAALGIGALGASLLLGYDPNSLNPRAKVQPPSIAHLLGTDEFGRDILSRLAHGGRITLLVAIASVILAAVGGTLLGTVAAYAGRGLEALIMRTMDGMLCFPPILLGIFVVTFLGPSLRNLILVIGVLYIPRFTRVVHSSTLAIRELEYVESAQALGASAVRIVTRAILPNILAPILVQASLAAGHAILLESGLSFLGLGPPPPTPSWGRMVEQSGRYMQLSILPLLWPSAAISMTVLAFNLLGDGLRDLLDPRLRI
jgi:peptide/nickel transport system permease protein